jgi:hypothetical protein
MKLFGFVKLSDLTYDYHISEASKLLGDPTEYEITPQFESRFFKDLSSVDGINLFLDATLAADMQREFSCTDDNQRHLVKGAFGRTLYFKKGVKKASSKNLQ